MNDLRVLFFCLFRFSLSQPLSHFADVFFVVRCGDHTLYNEPADIVQGIHDSPYVDDDEPRDYR